MFVFWIFALITAVFLFFMTKEVVSQMRTKELSLGVTYELVSAGSTRKKYSKAVVWISKGSFTVGEEKIDKSKYKLLVVDGKSMKRFGIEDGEIVFVSDEKNRSITERTFFVLKVYPNEKNYIKYKLRKPIDFYDCENDSEEKFSAWIENHPELNAEKLKLRYAEEKDVITVCNHFGCRLLVSETTRKGESHYSFHPENRIYGTVKYVLPKDKVTVIEKQ